jgi:hypothetical protein
MIIGVVCIFEAYASFTSGNTDKTSGYLFVGVGLFAFVRYLMLRRRTFLDKKKRGDFD